MCGFIGFTKNNKKLLKKLSKTLKERAIDKEYYFYLENLSFYHAHLSISDLDKNTSQPFFNEELVIGLVGEIYNKQDLLNLCEEKLLEDDFTELEVIAKCYKKLGKKFINYVNGEFSIFIYDIIKNKYLFFRDRWGTNNLYYTIKDGVLYFASEMKSLILERPKVSKKAFIEYMVFQFCISPNTIIDGIQTLRAGTFLEYKQGNIKISDFGDFKSKIKFDNIIDTIEYAVKSRIPKFQKQILLSLSGGPDSNLILYFLKKYYNGEIIAYSFETEKNNKEIDIARKNTQKLGVRHCIINMDDYKFLNIQEDIYTHEGLVQLPNLGKIFKKKFPEYKDIKVEFGGDGKEELILGNNHFPYEDILSRYKYFYSKGLIGEYKINQEFLNKEMFDFNLQMIDKITLRNGIERRLPFTDYELLKFYKYKNYRKEAEKFLNKQGLEIVSGEFGYNIGIHFSYLKDGELAELKDYLFKKLNENIGDLKI